MATSVEEERVSRLPREWRRIMRRWWWMCFKATLLRRWRYPKIEEES